MGLNQSFGFYGYSSDDGTTYAIKLSTENAVAGSFTTTVDPATVKVWPYKAKNMRHVEGKDASGNKTVLACATNQQSYYVSGGTFNLQGRAYTVLGQIGEKRKKNSIA